MDKIIVGGRTKVINCKIGDNLCGQLYPRTCKEIRDNLEVNTFYISDGKESVLIMNCDLIGLDRKFVKEVISER